MSEGGDDKPALPALLQQAHALVDRRRYEMARRLLAGALQDHPDDPQLLYFLAYIDYREGQLARAEQTLATVLVQHPKHFGARMLSGMLHESQKRYAQAEAVWIDLLKDYPESPDCYAAYADLMLKTLHLEKARRLTQEGLRLAPTHADCLFIACLIQVIQGRSLQRESQHLQQLLAEHPEKSSSLHMLLIALQQRGDMRGALRVAQQLLALNPASQSHVSLVRILRRNTHWSMLPLYPVIRWGWGGAVTLTLLGVVGTRIAANALPPAVALPLVYAWLAYVIYSWVWPRLLKRFI